MGFYLLMKYCNCSLSSDNVLSDYEWINERSIELFLIYVNVLMRYLSIILKQDSFDIYII